MNIDLSNQTAVVTGASSGIGKATAICLAKAGAKVFTGDIQLREETSSQFEELGIQEQVCDVTNLKQLQGLIDNAAEATGRLDILVNNAGIIMVKQVSDVSEDDWDRCIDTNVKSVFFGTKFALPHLLKTGGGAIVNTASNAGILPRSHDPVYSISKQAVVGMTRSLALCHSKDKIRVNCVCPGPVGDTEIMEEGLREYEDREAATRKFIYASPLARALDRMISPEEVANSILYLVSDAAKMVTGTSMTIDGGKSLGVPPEA
jgi:NAD(P)-dependent dehydrogenase (short-subunit alcohol dehydrogenase family)